MITKPTVKDIKYLRWCVEGAAIFSTCSKAQYMAIVVDRRGTVAATGYNGTPVGWTHCTDGGCPRALTQTTQGGSYNNCLAVHAEANALLRVSPLDCEGATIYVNGLPCWDCAKLIVGSGIKRIVYAAGRTPVDKEAVLGFLNKAGADLAEVTAQSMEPETTPAS